MLRNHFVYFLQYHPDLVQVLQGSPKTVNELANELQVTQSTIRSHLNGHPTYAESLIKSKRVVKTGEKILRRGGYAKVNIFGIK
ncbi:ArsR family transcriptional regulator [Candidatus Woesearchaeota archaeon]|nr:ArsR family transcriptional regulator [Candidatus Woesearchaeota archaeon]